MPMYAYKCDSCEQNFEIKQSMLDDPLRECILCNEGQVRRVINNVGIVFKGNGFYVTDTRKPQNGPTKTSSSSKTEKDDASPAKSTTSESTTAANTSPPST